jgi:hypothetical protein
MWIPIRLPRSRADVSTWLLGPRVSATRLSLIVSAILLTSIWPEAGERDW